MLNAGESRAALLRLPVQTSLTYAGLEFSGEHLYVGSNIGVLRFKDGAFDVHYRWHGFDDVVSGPWVGPGRGSLWFFDEHSGDFLLRTGEDWTWVPLPAAQIGNQSSSKGKSRVFVHFPLRM